MHRIMKKHGMAGVSGIIDKIIDIKAFKVITEYFKVC